jgi:hypothetical protein
MQRVAKAYSLAGVANVEYIFPLAQQSVQQRVFPVLFIWRWLSISIPAAGIIYERPVSIGRVGRGLCWYYAR